MKQTILLVAFFLITNLAFAQFGVTGRYHFNKAPDWVPIGEKDASDPHKFLGNGWSVGLDYWMRLKNYRIEFLSELNVAQFKSEPNSKIPAVESFSNQFYSFFLNTNFYLFDFLGDCNCPTFSKQGQLLKKGFFLQISPGITYLQNKVTINQEAAPFNGDLYESSDWAVSIGAGAGLDIGLSDFVTITPMVSLRYFPAAKWDQLHSYSNIREESLHVEESAIWQLSAGARLGFRLDYKSKGRRR